MYPFYLELELNKPVSDYFKQKNYQIYYEIQIGFSRADLVGFKNDKVVAVELKLNDWKKALVQAKNYQLGADYVYLAFPLKKSSYILKKTKDILKKEGIGFLVINEKNCEVKKILEARTSKKKICSITLEELRRNIKRNLNKKRRF